MVGAWHDVHKCRAMRESVRTFGHGRRILLIAKDESAAEDCGRGALIRCEHCGWSVRKGCRRSTAAVDRYVLALGTQRSF